DWVIGSFNRDLPYDQFVIHQIAGDLLPSPHPGGVNTEGIVASGFLAVGEWGIQDDNPEKMVWDTADENIDAVGRTFMGLTLGCTRCHDHKFDPLTTRDYYALAGIFTSTHVVAQPAKIGVHTPMIRTPLLSPAQIEQHKFETAQANARIEDAKRRLSAAADQACRDLARAEASRLAAYLAAAEEMLRRGLNDGARIAEAAKERGLSEVALAQWVDVLRGWTGGGTFTPLPFPGNGV